MGSRKEEERNEKIIRGLMKLPPNRRCINCNSLGPQYVCTNFWTFVCMTCSGIHREFTHRVKSVSMSKFTSQEVEALQNGGNQRARDIYLKDWDLQRQRLPDSSNADKIRDFIKNVYVDSKYAGGKTTDKPPKDMQSLRNHEDEIRRASSYHSYSQSPPYDYQYEDRRYGKQVAAALSRKPGSDRGHYVGKVSSFVYSPGRLSDQMIEDRVSSEGSAPRISDYSTSSGGDPFKSGTGSPNFQKDIGVVSPTARPPRDAEGNSRPQRTKSMGSFGSFDSNSLSVKSCNSGNELDIVSTSEQTAGSYHDKVSTFAQSSVPVNYGGLDLFNTPEAPASPPVDLFQLPTTSSVSSGDIFQPAAVSSMPPGNLHQPPPSTPPVDLFQLPPTSSVSSGDVFQPASVSSTSPGNLHQPPPSTPSIDLFAGIAEQPLAASFDGKPPELPVPKNEGWATFDTPQHATSDLVTKKFSPPVVSSDGGLAVKFDQWSSLTMQWPQFENSSALGSAPATSSQWQKGLHDSQAFAPASSTQSWNAFNDSAESLSWEPQVAYNQLATTDQHLGLGLSENLKIDGIQTAAHHSNFPAATLPSEDGIASSYAPSGNPLLGEKQSHAADRKSSNPFDLPYDSEFEQNDMFLDMSSLQTALPNAQLPSTFLDGASEPWFPQNPVTPYIPAATQGSPCLLGTR
ncbi:hypothetical protein PTKIN_Ptkin01aG0384600 [Pterospermum kingtungense]